MQPNVVTNATDLVTGASPAIVIDSLEKSVKYIRQFERWLDRRNTYPNTASSLKKTSDLDERRLAEYIGCSAPLHLADGWNYISRAFEAALKGDHSAAFHLAYYAELRGAISLLASEGIGIFNQLHVALDDHRNPTALRKPTHEAAWLTLQAWAEQPNNAIRILQAIRLDSIDLSQWLSLVGISNVKQSVLAKELLMAWSIDLKMMGDDRDRRNEVSYRPTRIGAPKLPSVNGADELLTALIETWELLEPVGRGRDAIIDVPLFLQVLKFLVERGSLSFGSVTDAAMSVAGDMSRAASERLAKDLTKLPWMFRYGGIESPPGGEVLPILARAILMLRIASAMTAALLNSATVRMSDIEFWWSPLGEDMGLWQDGQDLTTFADLKSDIEQALDAMQALDDEPLNGPTVASVGKAVGSNLELTQFVRPSLWLMGLE